MRILENKIAYCMWGKKIQIYFTSTMYFGYFCWELWDHRMVQWIMGMNLHPDRKCNSNTPTPHFPCSCVCVCMCVEHGVVGMLPSERESPKGRAERSDAEAELERAFSGQALSLPSPHQTWREGYDWEPSTWEGVKRNLAGLSPLRTLNCWWNND